MRRICVNASSMIVTCPLLCRISRGNVAPIIVGIPSGRHAVARSASGSPFAEDSRAACTLACHSFRCWGFKGGWGCAGIDASLARSHEPVMSGIGVEACCARAAIGAKTAAAQTIHAVGPNARLDFMARLLLFGGALEGVGGRNAKLSLFAAGQRHFEKQSARLTAQQRSSDRLYLI